MAEHNCSIGRGYARASFKGVGFDCTEADIEGGRRGAEGEFPFSERTAYADLGRKIRVFHLSAVFRRDSHVSDASALFRACESPGPGILVHPTRGTHMVACRSVKVKDEVEDSEGESKAELEFVEANSIGIGGLIGSLFGIISSGLNGASRTTFLAGYRPEHVAQPWRADLIDEAQVLTSALFNTVVQTLPPDASIQAWRDALAIEEVAKDDGLAGSAPHVDKVFISGFSILTENIKDPDTKFKVMRKLVNLAIAPMSRLPFNAPAIKSEEALLSRYRTLASIGMAEAAMSRKYSHIGDALAAMDAVLMVFADETKAAYDDCNNGLYLELRNYAVQFSDMMYKLAYGLPPLIVIDFMGGVHPLVAAYAVYSDAKRHRELEQRNMVDANGRFKPLIMGIAPA